MFRILQNKKHNPPLWFLNFKILKIYKFRTSKMFNFEGYGILQIFETFNSRL